MMYREYVHRISSRGGIRRYSQYQIQTLPHTYLQGWYFTFYCGHRDVIRWQDEDQIYSSWWPHQWVKQIFYFPLYWIMIVVRVGNMRWFYHISYEKSKLWIIFSILQNWTIPYSILMKLIIWLGNPGKQYKNTRHNIGFMMIDTIFWDFREEKKFKSLISDDCLIQADSSRILWIKPDTFMNLSGDAVVALVWFYKLDPKTDIIIISDDIDMEFWKVRFRSEWSHGGQNWLKDITLKLGTNEFSRIKIGIGRDERYTVSDWVLSQITPSEKIILDKEVFPKVQEYIKKWLWD